LAIGAASPKRDGDYKRYSDIETAEEKKNWKKRNKLKPRLGGCINTATQKCCMLYLCLFYYNAGLCLSETLPTKRKGKEGISCFSMKKKSIITSAYY